MLEARLPAPQRGTRGRRGGARVEERPASGKLRHALLPGVSTERVEPSAPGPRRPTGWKSWGHSSFPSIPPLSASQASGLPSSERIRTLFPARRLRSRAPTPPGHRSRLHQDEWPRGQTDIQASLLSPSHALWNGVASTQRGGLIHNEGHNRGAGVPCPPTDRGGIFSYAPNLCSAPTWCLALCWVMLGTQQ